MGSPAFECGDRAVEGGVFVIAASAQPASQAILAPEGRPRAASPRCGSYAFVGEQPLGLADGTEPEEESGASGQWHPARP